MWNRKATIGFTKMITGLRGTGSGTGGQVSGGTSADAEALGRGATWLQDFSPQKFALTYPRREDRMKWFTDLAVLGKSDALGKLIPAIESRLPPDAHRDFEAEIRFAAGHPGTRRYFIRLPRSSDEIVFALEQYPELICFDNVFIYPGKCLTAPEYSALLEDFFWKIVKPAADELRLKYFSSGFEDRCPEWAKRRRRSAMEIALGFTVVWRLRTEGYISHFPVRNETAGGSIDRNSILHQLLRMSPSSQN